MPKTYLLIDPKSGEPVGMHVFADGLESSLEEIAEHASSHGRGRLKVEQLAQAQPGRSRTPGPAASKRTQGPTGSGGTSSAAGAGPVKGDASATAAIESLVRKYRRAG